MRLWLLPSSANIPNRFGPLEDLLDLFVNLRIHVEVLANLAGLVLPTMPANPAKMPYYYHAHTWALAHRTSLS